MQYYFTRCVLNKAEVIILGRCKRLMCLTIFGFKIMPFKHTQGCIHVVPNCKQCIQSTTQDHNEVQTNHA